MGWIGPHHLVLVLLLAFLFPHLINHQFDPFAFIRIGTRFDPNRGAHAMGYDGQFAYQIARDPAQAAPYLDVPAYRYQRILYPLLARFLALGQVDWLPWSMLLLNLAAVTLGTWATARLLAERDCNPWFALAYPLNVGMLLSLRLDLNEPLAFLFVQLGFWAWLAGHEWHSAAAFALAGLTKEVTLILAAGLVVHLAMRGQRSQALMWGAFAAAPFVLWQVFLRFWLGSWGVRSGGALASSFSLLPYRNWWSLAGFDGRTFLTVSLVIVPLAILPATFGLYLAVRSHLGGEGSGPAAALGLQSLLYPFLPASNLLDPLGVSRFSLGLIAALLAFGAVQRSRRVLAYAQLWILTVVFALGDNFVPGY